MKDTLNVVKQEMKQSSETKRSYHLFEIANRQTNALFHKERAEISAVEP